MLLAKKIKLDSEIHRQALLRSQTLGYASIEDYVAHLIQRDAGSGGDERTKQKVLDQMKGLGYIQ